MEGHRELLGVARDETGLNDFGDDSFREGLEILTRSLSAEAGLNAFGEQTVRNMILGHLKQRLMVEDWYRLHPETDETEIEAPLFGISLPRTGSTALSFLLAADPGVRYIRAWESPRPCPPPSTVQGPDPRREQQIEFERQMTGDRSFIPSGVDGPWECLDLMALDFKSQTFTAFAKIPAYSEWLLNADLTPTYLYERRVLKLLQWGEPARPWRLKTPMHLLYLDHLDRAFPDARFVMTHRDPTEVLLSVAELYANAAGMCADKVDYTYIGELNVHTWVEGMRRAMAFRERHGDQRFYDIDFRAMQKDPVGEVRGLYDWLGEPVTETFASNMAVWWKQNDESRQQAPKADPAKFGLDLAEVRNLFEDYIERMPTWTAHAIERPRV